MVKLKLLIGNKNYSSWSMRPWVLMRHSGIEFEEMQVPLQQPDTRQRVLQYSPTGKVPCLIADGASIWDSIAICEFLNEEYPDKNLWPVGRMTRAMARSASAEMHSGFQNLRTHMFMNVRGRFPTKGREPGVQEDIDRIQELWANCRDRFAKGGKFLFGGFCIADAMFAPVVLRFQTYGVDVTKASKEYMDTILGLPAVQEWIAGAKAETWTIPAYEHA